MIDIINVSPVEQARGIIEDLMGVCTAHEVQDQEVQQTKVNPEDDPESQKPDLI